MAKRKYTRRKTKNKNSFMIFFIIIIVLAIASFVITYYVTKTDVAIEEKIAKVEETPTQPTKPVSVPDKLLLEGTWASYNDGAMLTITGQKFTIELPSVESNVVASGRIVIVGSKATFIYTHESSECGVKPGVYEFIIQNEEEVTFKKVEDECSSRSTQLSATWFRV